LKKIFVATINGLLFSFAAEAILAVQRPPYPIKAEQPDAGHWVIISTTGKLRWKIVVCRLQSTRTHAQQAAEDLKSAAGAIAGKYSGKVEQDWDDARDHVRTFQEDADKYVRENPTKAVFTALGIGVCPGPNLPALIAVPPDDQRDDPLP
jgi:ElaB/YqjD/DUF883 family membrane-anchored ribosome-binding protein